MLSRYKLFAFALVMIAATPTTIIAGGNGTVVTHLKREPFIHDQCYSTADAFPGPAATFEQDVCVAYSAVNTVTTRFKKNGDVSWSLVQTGTAMVRDIYNNTLYMGPFEVEEIARDKDGDAGCVTTASDGLTQIAYIGTCDSLRTNLDYLTYQWKITGNAIYSFRLIIRGPGNYCYSSKQGGLFGPAC